MKTVLTMPAKNRLPVNKDAKAGKLILHKTVPAAAGNDLFECVVGILEQARAGVVRAVNSRMVLAYWLIGREIVQEIQGGEGRAAYGRQVVDALSKQLTEKYGRGFSTTNLRYFRTFFNTYSNRAPEIRQIESGELAVGNHNISTPEVLEDLSLSVGTAKQPPGFSPALGWSHYQLELGKGFAFVGRQKRMQYDADFFYIDLVFYNCILKCFLLIDLKIGDLTHQDVGQMDSYVRMFDDKYLTAGDNPSIGLILCAEKNETVAKYSVLNDCKQIFASKYMLYLPTEQELSREIERERRHLEKQTKSSSPEPKRKGKQSRLERSALGIER